VCECIYLICTLEKKKKRRNVLSQAGASDVNDDVNKSNKCYAPFCIPIIIIDANKKRMAQPKSDKSVRQTDTDL